MRRPSGAPETVKVRDGGNSNYGGWMGTKRRQTGNHLMGKIRLYNLVVMGNK